MGTTPQPQINAFVGTDKDGILWCFPRQEFNNSCGPACLRFTKSLIYDCEFTESDARKQVSQFELLRPVGRSETQSAFEQAKLKAANQTSVKSVKQALKMILTPQDPSTAHQTRASGPWIGDASWQGLATRPELVVNALQGGPMPVATARMVSGDYLTHLTRTTSRYPAIVAVFWVVDHKNRPATNDDWELARKAQSGSGGHFVLCVGLTNDGSQFIILDPMNGLRYINRADVTADCILYDSGSSIGKAEVSLQKNPKPTTVDEKLVEYVARGRFSKCGVIVTYPET